MKVASSSRDATSSAVPINATMINRTLLNRIRHLNRGDLSHRPDGNVSCTGNYAYVRHRTEAIDAAAYYGMWEGPLGVVRYLNSKALTTRGICHDVTSGSNAAIRFIFYEGEQ